MAHRPNLSFWQIWNMNFGFLGIQIGFALQLSFMSNIFSKLGSSPSEIPILWLAAPLTGLLVQPIIGALSDRTWTRLGRRRPFFFFGAISSAVCLFFMPDAPALRFAVLGLWFMDTSFNVAMEPFRAFVGDKLPPVQRTLGFITQSFFIGLGGVIGARLPSILGHLGVVGTAPNGLPMNLYLAFKIGAVLLLLAIFWTVFTTKENPPEDMEAFEKERKNAGPFFEIRPSWLGVGALAGVSMAYLRGQLVEGHLTSLQLVSGGVIGLAIALVLSKSEVSVALREMPKTMKQLAAVQFFTWLGLFCMWMMFGLATAQQVFGTLDPKSPAFDEGTTLAGVAGSWRDIVCFGAAFVLPVMALKLGRRKLHALALGIGAVGLLSTGLIHTNWQWQMTQVAVGVAWASVLSMPYAMLSTAIPAKRMGVYMGIFNFFIVIPEIMAAVALEPIMKRFFEGDPVKVVMIGGCSFVVAALLALCVNQAAEAATAE